MSPLSITLTGESTQQTEAPPNSPLPATQDFLSLEHAQRLVAWFNDIAAVAQLRTPSPTKNVPAPLSPTPTDSIVTVVRARASKLEYRKVQEV